MPGTEFDEIFATHLKREKRSDLQPGAPANMSGTGPARIPIALLFKGKYAVDIVIDNTDGVLALTYRVNSDAAPVKTVPVGGTISINDTKVVFIQIVAAGAWELSFNLVSRF